MRYLSLIILGSFLSFSSCSLKYPLREPSRIDNFELNFTEVGIEPTDYGNLPIQEWWESFYQHLVSIEGSDLGYYFQLEHNTELDSLVELIESRGEQFYSDRYGNITYLTFGNNSKVISDVSYFRLLNIHSLSASRRLEFLIEKGVEVTWEYIPKEMRTKNTHYEDSEDQPTPWILYRVKISKLVADQRGLFNRAFTLSFDKYYCFTGIDGTRRVRLAEGNRRYGDLIIPESKGYPIIDGILRDGARAYNAHYMKGLQ